MRFIAGIVAATLVTTALLGGTTARGDGWCQKGFRDTTTSERATATAVLDAAKVALPPTPPGWVVNTESVNAPPESLCADQDNVPWTYGITRYYQRTDDQEARNDVLAKAAAEMSAAIAAKQPRLDAIMAKVTALSQEAATAAQKSDWARVEELNKQSEQLSAEYKAVLEEGGTNEKLQAASAEVSQDREISVAIRVNSGFEAVGASFAPFPTPAGAQAAYRWSEDRGEIKEDSVLVLIGSWQEPSQGAVQALSNAAAPSPAAQSMSVRVAAAANRITDVVGTMDFTKLAATVLK